MMISNVVLAIVVLIAAMCVYFGFIMVRDANSSIDKLNAIVKWAEEELKSRESESTDICSEEEENEVDDEDDIDERIDSLCFEVIKEDDTVTIYEKRFKTFTYEVAIYHGLYSAIEFSVFHSTSDTVSIVPIVFDIEEVEAILDKAKELDRQRRAAKTGE